MDPATPSTKLRRHPERAVPDEIGEILLAGIVAHIGIVEDGLPVVIPMTYAYDPATPNVVYIHGATVARILAGAMRGAPACVGTVRGFRHLDQRQRAALRPLLSPWLTRKLDADAAR